MITAGYSHDIMPVGQIETFSLGEFCADKESLPAASNTSTLYCFHEAGIFSVTLSDEAGLGKAVSSWNEDATSARLALAHYSVL